MQVLLVEFVSLRLVLGFIRLYEIIVNCNKVDFLICGNKCWNFRYLFLEQYLSLYGV